MSSQNVIKLPVERQVNAETNRFNFTLQRLEKLPITGKTYYVRDLSQPGLCMRVTNRGSKSFVYYRKVHGKPERINLGKLGAISITDARKACKQYDGQRALGINPAELQREARVKGITVDELMNSWIRSAKARGLRRWSEEQRLYELHIKGSFGKKEAISITVRNIESLMTRLQDKPRTANKAHDLLRRIYKHAIKQRLITENPCQGVTRYAENVRDRVLSPEEIEIFISAVELEPEPWKSYFKLLLLTGARKSAVASMRWCDLDLENNIWTIPGWASKNKKALAIALVPDAVKTIEQLEKIDTDWVFPSNSKSGHIETPTKSWERIRNRSGLEDIRIHDLRRTLGTTLAVQGASSHVIAKALGHKSLQSAAAYVHMDAEVARNAIEGATKGWVK